MLYAIPRMRGGIVRAQSALARATYRPHFGPGLLVFGWPIITFAKGSTAKLGANTVLISHSRFSEPGIGHPVVLRNSDHGSHTHRR